MCVYSAVNPFIVEGAYSRVSVDGIPALVPNYWGGGEISYGGIPVLSWPKSLHAFLGVTPIERNGT